MVTEANAALRCDWDSHFDFDRLQGMSAVLAVQLCEVEMYVSTAVSVRIKDWTVGCRHTTYPPNCFHSILQ